MSEFKTTSDYSLVSIILPKLTGEPVVQSLGKNGARHILQSTSRGSLLNEGSGFFSKMFPPPAPEQELFQLLVPKAKLGDVMQDAVDAGYLNRAGSGAIFAMPCQGEVQHTDSFPILTADGFGDAIGDSFATDMEAIISIVEIGTGDNMAEAALSAGSSGPTITYGEGGGVRDKIQLLRLTKGPEKEIVIAVVEKGEADKVFADMARAGKITEPGRGFMYTTPVNRGLINVSTSFSGAAGASLDQIIGAIDEMKGGRDWRSNAPAAATDSSKSGGKTPLLTDLTELVGLFCLVHRDHYYPTIYDAILDAGAGGVSVVFGTLRDPTAPADAANEEWASVQTSIAPAALDKVRDAIKDTVQREGIDSACLFTYNIEKAATYIPG